MCVITFMKAVDLAFLHDVFSH